MSSALYEWRTLGHRYRLCHSGTRAEGWLVLSPFAGLWAVQDWLRFSEDRRVMSRVVLGNWRGIFPPNLAAHGVLEREVEEGRLIVLDEPIAPIVLGNARAIQTPETRRKNVSSLDRAWIDITVVDNSVPAKPLTGIRFRLSLPDGSTRAGTLGGQGHLRVDDIEAGKCSLELSDLVLGFKA